MLCPSCGHDNIPGVDLCDECGSDLAGLDLPEAGSGVGGRLLTDAIADLPLAPRVTATPEETVATVVRRMREERQGYAMVFEEDRLVGIFTERDVLQRIVGKGTDPEATPVGEAMTPDPTTLRPQDPPAWAMHRMVSQDFRHLPIASGASGASSGDVVGLLSIRGVLRYLYEDVLGGSG